MEAPSVNLLEFVRVGGLISALVVMTVTWLIGRAINGAADRMASSSGQFRLVIKQTAGFIRFFVYVVAVVLSLRLVFDLSPEVLTVVGGTIVVTVGLVLKDQAASILAGITLLVEKPFNVGDRVAFAGYYGEIKSIGLRSVRLVTLDDNEVTIPNSKFLTEPVASANSGALTMLVQQDFYIEPNQDIALAKKIVEESLVSSPYFFVDKPWAVLVNQIALDSMMTVRLRAKAYVLEIRFEKTFESDVAQRVMEGFRDAEIRMPVPH